MQNTQFKSLTEFAAEIERREAVKNDFVVPGSKLLMENDTNLGIENTGSYGMSDHSHSQVASRLSIPKKYYDEMATVPGLRSYNVNAWLRNNNDKYMVRTMDGSARAFLSDRYRPIDNLPILAEAVLPALHEYQGIQVVSSNLSDKRMYLQVAIPTMELEVKKGDVVRYGLMITNSEIGCGALDIKSLIWRLVCTNGMIGESLVRKYHSGKRLVDTEDSYEVFQDDTINSELSTWKLKIRDIIKAAMTDQVFTAIVDRMKEAREDKIENITDTVENVTKRYSGILTERDKDGLIKNIITESEFNRYGLANSITYLAHAISNPDRQYEVERLGNEIITMTTAEWREVA